MFATAIHQIKDVHDGKKRTVEPKTVFPISKEYYKELEALGAVRIPTETELALYGLANQAAPKPAPVAAAPTPAPAPAADADTKVYTDGLEPKFRGAAKWSVIKGPLPEDRLVDGLDTRELADAWIADYRAKAEVPAADDAAQNDLLA